MTTERTTSDEHLLRLPAVEARTGLKKTAIYRAVKVGDFPAPIKLGPRVSVWPASAITRWINDRIAKSGTSSAQPSQTARV